MTSTALLLPGTAGANATTPDHASLDITGDIDIRIDLTVEDATPAADQVLISKWGNVAANQSWQLFVTTTGQIVFRWRDSALVASSDIFNAGSLPAGRVRLRVTFDANNGSGGRVTTLYKGASLAGPWTEVQAIVGLANDIVSGAAMVEIGTVNGGTVPFNGQVHAAEVRNGIGGTVVTNPDFSAQALGVTSFVDSTGKTYTVNGDATFINVGREMNPEVLQALAQANFGRDLNGAVRTASGSNSDLNGVCRELFGKEANECHSELVALLTP